MSTAVLKAETRELNLSRGELNKKRKAGLVPAVVYGKEIESLPIFVDLLSFKKIYTGHGKIFELNVGGKTHMVNTKKIEKNVLGNIVNHINFHKLKAGQSTTVSIAVSLVGEAKGLKEGGIVNTVLDTLPIKGLPKDMPEKVEVDVSELELNGQIVVGDIKLPGKLTIELEADKTVVTCAAPKVQAEEPAEAAAEGEAGAEAPAAEGDAPAAEAAAETKSEE